VTQHERSANAAPTAFEPKHPTLLATVVLSLWIAILSLPAWTGKFIGGAYSDQYHTGYAFRDWLASEFKRTGHIPLWNPEIFGGLPFVGAMHGDIFYPTAWLRLILPTGIAMDLGFIVHYVLAGLFMYLLLRLFRVSWAGAVTGGFAYQLSGVIGSYVQPGHDGKLFVTALLPLALIGLVMGLRDRRAEGYGVLGLAVGLAMVSPQAQMTYYLLITAGIFALYLAFEERPREEPLGPRLQALGLALVAVVLGFGIGMIQFIPFFRYLPYSPRAGGITGGFAGSTSYAIPWVHVPEFVLANFVGTTPSQTYWGPNGLKLHSEYLGLPVVALAVVGAMSRSRRRLILWLGAIGLLFLLVALGAGTPFYRLWWAVMPFVKKTRAPGMALYVVALVLAALAAFGVDRVQQGGASRRGLAWMVIGGAVALLAIMGVPGVMAESLAQGVQMTLGLPTAAPAHAAQASIRFGATVSGLALAALGGLALAWERRRIPIVVVALGIPLIVSADLWRNAAGFWTWSPPPKQDLYAGDALTAELRQVPLPFRVLDLPGGGGYPGSALMAYHIPQLLGYHGVELHAFDELMGGKNVWKNALAVSPRSQKLWDLFAVRYVLLPVQGGVPDSIPGFVRRPAPVTTAGGTSVVVFERTTPPAYAWLATAALKLDDSSAVLAVLDPRLPPRSVVLLAPDAPVNPPPLQTIPAPARVTASVTAWEPGRMTVALDSTLDSAAYLVIAENWYTAWTATVDGVPAPVLRANVAQMAVPVPAGARKITLEYRSSPYKLGRALTLLSLMAVVAFLVVPPVLRRRRG
jgi:hypothetical protein